MLNYDYIIITKMGYQHNKKRNIKSTISMKETWLEHCLCYFSENYYCSPLILNDFMCGLNIVMCIGGVKDGGEA